MRDVLIRRRDTLKMIADDEWAITVYRRPLDKDDLPSTWTCTGRIVRAALAVVTAERLPRGMMGEMSTSSEYWELMLPYDEPALLHGDSVVAVQDYITHHFEVVNGAQLSYKVTALMKEVQ